MSIQRRERPKARQVIEQILNKNDWDINQFQEYIKTHRWQFSQGLITQVNKMQEEYQDQQYFKNLKYIDYRGTKYPIIYCREEGGQWVFYCHYCRRVHRHSKGEGHRCSHCHNLNSPLGQGYFLKLEAING